MRVLIPRGGDWGDEVARRVAEAGFDPLVLPLVRIEPPQDEAPLSEALDRLAEGAFDWLVVTSRSAARVLPRIPPSVHVAAVGAVTADALRERGIPVAFVPTRQSAAGLVEEWPMRDGSVLWPRALDARPTVADGLRALGMEVTEVVAYRTVAAFDDEDALADALPADAWAPSRSPEAASGDTDAVLTAVEPAATPIDAALVTSGSVAKQVARLGLGSDARVVAIGAQTADDCRRYGLPLVGIAASPDPASLVQALIDASRGRNW